MRSRPISPFPAGVALVRVAAEALTESDVEGAWDSLAAGGRSLVLDLGGVTLLTAGGLGRIVALHKRLRAAGGRLILGNVGAAAYEVLVLTRLTDVLDVRRRGVSVLPSAAAGGWVEEVERAVAP